MTQEMIALTENSRKVLAQRYLIRNSSNEITETPGEMFQRVAKTIASVEENDFDAKLYEEAFYQTMYRLEFLPNTPCLVNAGRPGGTGQFSACFVIPVPDSMEGIFEAVKQMALVHKTGGGTGFSFSRLRPAGDMVKTTSGVASGPVSFMIPFDATTQVTKQGGVRRGANMGILRVDHPDIMQFIRLKLDRNLLQNFNVSVAITNKFMDALAKDGDFDLIHPVTGKVHSTVKASDIWSEIVRCAHIIGDPGLFFIDRANERDPLVEALGPIEATNPCGEVPLRAHDACTLGSINVANFYAENKPHSVDWERLGKTVTLAVRFLDNVLTCNKYPVKEIHDITSASRKIGLGVMGFAELLIMKGMPYRSDAAITFGEQLMQTISLKAIEASVKLATERGPFPLFSQSKHAKGAPRRNSTCTVIAPTGSISIIAGCSSGIEPLFALAMKREQAGLTMHEFNPLVMHVADKHKFNTQAFIDHVKETGSASDAPGVSDHWQNVLQVANEIPIAGHIGMQAAFQRHTEDGVSKTINMHKQATQDDVNAAYMMAWTSGCKGITVYRDGSREGQVLTAGAAPKPVIVSNKRRTIPDNGWRDGRTCTKKTSSGSVHVTINDHPDDGYPFEVFVRLGKGGTEVNAWTEAQGRQISYTLSIPSTESPRKRMEAIVEQLSGIGGGDSIGIGAERISSVADAIGKVMQEYLESKDVKVHIERRDLCPQCHQPSFVIEAGCGLCKGCGFSRC